MRARESVESVKFFKSNAAIQRSKAYANPSGLVKLPRRPLLVATNYGNTDGDTDLVPVSPDHCI